MARVQRIRPPLRGRYGTTRVPVEDDRRWGLSSDLEKPRKKWTSAERAQVWLTAVGILVAIIALAGQFAQYR